MLAVVGGAGVIGVQQAPDLVLGAGEQEPADGQTLVTGVAVLPVIGLADASHDDAVAPARGPEDQRGLTLAAILKGEDCLAQIGFEPLSGVLAG